MNRNGYNKNHCWQYDIRQQNKKSDLIEAGLSETMANTLKVPDFEFSFVDSSHKVMCQKIKNFISRHEWLGKMPTRPTHRFIATYKGILAGVVVMGTPNSFSNLLGKPNRDLEKLISRGACISWSPKNLGSSLIMFAIKWMVKNTGFRFFTAYSDVEARELGTIYQACNFGYLGQSSGAIAEYFDPKHPELGWFSDRRFRKASQIRRYAKEIGIEWQKEWSGVDKIYWDQIPPEITKLLKQKAKDHKTSCLARRLPRKHKYIYILGQDQRETKYLKKLFHEQHPELTSLTYPKARGPQENDERSTIVTAANFNP